MTIEDLPGGEQTLDAVVEQYVAEVTRLSQGVFGSENRWAGERIGHLGWLGRPAEALEILLAAVGRIDEERVLCQLGAGELEGLINSFPDVLDELERRAPDDPRLVTALRCVWAMPGPAKERLAAILEPLA